MSLCYKDTEKEYGENDCKALRKYLIYPKSISKALNISNINYENVEWLEKLNSKFCVISTKDQVNSQPLYKKGLLQSIDAASILTATLLGAKPGENILDMCCAPCGKFNVISEMMDKNGCLVGVDNSNKRLNIAGNILRKYNTCNSSKPNWSCFLIKADGLSFNPKNQLNEIIWSTVYDKELTKNCKTYSSTYNKKRKRFISDIDLLQDSLSVGVKTLSRATKRHLSKFIEQKTSNESILDNIEYFDRVLVDVECTTDGSQYHSSKYLNKTTEIDKNKLETLQRKILMNSFKLLKPNGILVYSTCSYLRRQNEDIILWLQKNIDIKLEIINLRQKYPNVPAEESNILKGCLKLSPSISQTNGMFICKLRKGKH